MKQKNQKILRSFNRGFHYLMVAVLLLVFITPILSFPERATAQAVPPHSVDGILVFEKPNDDGTIDIRYTFRGHSPAVPTQTNPIANWNWFSGDPQAPILNTSAVLANGREAGLFTYYGFDVYSKPKVAFSREGYALIVYTRFVAAGEVDCPEPIGRRTRTRGDLYWILLQDGVPGFTSGPLAIPTDPSHYYVAPSVAINSSGNGMAIWQHVYVDDPCLPTATATFFSSTHYSVWNGTDYSWSDNAHVGGGEEHIRHRTDETIDGGILGNATGPATETSLAYTSVLTNMTVREQAVAVWMQLVDFQKDTCDINFEILGPTFWPYYSLYNGAAWSPPALIPDPPNKWKSLQGGTIDISSDQRGNAVAVWEYNKVNNMCTSDFVNEVWYGRHRGAPASPTGTWERGATQYGEGTEPTIAFEPGDEISSFGGQTATSFYIAPGGTFGSVVRRAGYETSDVVPDLWNTLDDIDAPATEPTTVYLPHFRRLTVFDTGFLRARDEDRAATPPTVNYANLGVDPDYETGSNLDLAARSGSPTMPHARWSVIYYGAGDDAPSQDNKMGILRDRVQQVGSTNLISWVFHRDRPTAAAVNTQSHYVKQGAITLIRDWGANLNFGNGNTLRDIIAWNKEFYPADKYILDLSNHGEGWRGVCVDSQGGADDWVQMPELRQGIIDGLQDAVGDPIASQPLRLSHLIFNACLMSMVEVAYQVRNLTGFMLASGENKPTDSVGPPPRGLRYQNILQQMVNTPFMADQNLANFIVNDYQAANAGFNDSDYNFASTRTANVPALVADLNTLAGQITNYVNPGGGIVPANRTRIRNHVTNTIRMRGDNTYRDLFDFAQNLAGDGANLPPVLIAAANAVLGHRANVITNVWSDANTGSGDAVQVVRGANTWGGLNVWIEITRAMLINPGPAGGNTGLSNRYLATDFGGAAPNWHAMLLTIAQTPGVLFNLESNDSLLLFNVTDQGGNIIRIEQNSGEDCPLSCSSDINDASCKPNFDGLSQIFIPLAEGNYTWVVDGSLISSSTGYTLTIEQLSDDLNIIQEQQVSGTLDPGGTNSGVFSTIVSNLPPDANITFTPASPLVGETITFNANASDPDGWVVGWDWDFGDGNTASGDPVTHQYQNSGNYTVLLRVTDNLGAFSDRDILLSVNPVTQVSQTFPPGWSMMSVSLQPVDPNPEVVFAGNAISGNLHRYDHTGQRYVTYFDFNPSEFGNVRQGDGYWLSCLNTAGCTVQYFGIPSSGNLEIDLPTSGWYLLGASDIDADFNNIQVNNGVETRSFAQAANVWLQDPLVGYSNTESRYVSTGLLPTDEDHFLRLWNGYWVYAFEPNLTLIIPSSSGGGSPQASTTSNKITQQKKKLLETLKSGYEKITGKKKYQ